MRADSAQARLEGIENWDLLVAASDYDATRLALNCGVSLRTLERFFHRKFHASPRQVLHQIRQVRAEELARQGQRTKEIALNLGYKRASHFCKDFKNSHGLSPQSWSRDAGTS